VSVCGTPAALVSDQPTKPTRALVCGEDFVLSRVEALAIQPYGRDIPRT
jgi:hypothetical protein